ncbi:LINE-1 reverse transcriptase-like protein [Bienertia sinuspersici]
MKPWTEDMDLSKEIAKTIPIWIQVSVHFKYWGIRALEKIVKPIGRLIRMDATTTKREKLQYARVMVEVLIDQYFPDSVTFMNEKGCQVKAPIGTKELENTKNGELVSNITECQEKVDVGGGAGNREILWQDLTEFAASQTGPWMIMGDLNCVLQMEERCGTNVRMQEILPGRTCMERCGLIDIPYGGHFFTWSNKQVGEDRVFSKIDRDMANKAWLEIFSRFNATFLPEGISDHCPALVRIINDDSEGKKPFKYYKMWREAEGYKEKVRIAWEGTDQGTSMYRITKKLNRVKTCLKELNRLGFCTIQADAQQAYQRLMLAQQQVHASPNDAGTAELEKEALKNYKSKQRIYEKFLQQKAKCQWIREGDSNTAFFHKSIKQRRLQNTIYAIRDCKGVLQDNPSSVAGAFLEYYKDLLGVKEKERQKVQKEIVDLGPVKIYSGLEDQVGDVQWVDNVWNRFNIPKHKFCAWLAIQDRLPTAVRMHRWEPNILQSCSLCEQGDENGIHLFFECPYSMEILHKVKQWMGISSQVNTLENLYKWISRRGKYQKAKQACYNAAITAAVYFVWYARNQVKHGNNRPSVEQLVDQLKFQVTHKLRMINKDKVNNRERIWLKQLLY